MILGLDNSGKTSILNKLVALNQPASHQESSQSIADSKSSTSLASSSDTPSSRHSSSVRRQLPSSTDADHVTPTVGYNYERIQYKGLTLTVLDFSGQNRYRNLWQEFYNCVDAIVFVVDSSDLIRLVVVRDELETLLSHPYFGSLSGDDGANLQTTNNNGNLDRQLTLNPVGAQKQITLTQGKLVQSPLDQSCPSSSSSLASTLSAQSTVATGRRRRVKIPILFLANKCDLANSVDIEIIVRALNLNQLPKSRHPWFIQATSVNSPSQGIGEGFDWLVSQLSPATTATTTPQP